MEEVVCWGWEWGPCWIMSLDFGWKVSGPCWVYLWCTQAAKKSEYWFYNDTGDILYQYVIAHISSSVRAAVLYTKKRNFFGGCGRSLDAERVGRQSAARRALWAPIARRGYAWHRPSPAERFLRFSDCFYLLLFRPPYVSVVRCCELRVHVRIYSFGCLEEWLSECTVGTPPALRPRPSRYQHRRTQTIRRTNGLSNVVRFVWVAHRAFGIRRSCDYYSLLGNLLVVS